MKVLSRPMVRLFGLVVVLATMAAGGGVEAQRAGAQGGDNQRDRDPGWNFDARSQGPAVRAADAALGPSASQLTGLVRLQSQIPDLLVSVDQITGGTRSVFNAVGSLSEPAGGDALDIGLEWVQANLQALGLTAADVGEYEVTDRVFSAVSGVTHIYLRQQYRGIPVYNAQLHFSVARDGRMLIVNNQFVPDLATAVAGLGAGVSPGQAVRAAALHQGESIGFEPRTDPPDASAQQASRVAHDGISLEPIEAKLMYLPIRPGEVRLVWNFQIHTGDAQHAFDYTVDASTSEVWTRFDWVAGDTYRAYPIPLESPNHNTTTPPPADGRSLLTNPHNVTASPFAWHDTNGAAGAEFTIMRGNNVHAYDDIDNNNAPPAVQPDCGAGLACDFASNLTLEPSTYTSAAVANLFYWNNIVHDVQYQYGFDEAGGNFQGNNYGRGGGGALGNDDVMAEAQDGSGINNANFFTPPDGSRPRMQMYRWTYASPARDSDYDAGVIVHEYGHGISNRLVGGPSNVSCLNNTQQPGEGLSDWWALAYTAKSGDTGSTGRGIGTYVVNQPTSGAGIRAQRYSTDPDINTWTYASITGLSGVHAIGAVWAQAAWEVYWSLVNSYGFNANLYNATGGAGNQRAMLYINEGLKLTACSPTFIDVRNGIIAATTAINAGADTCRVWDAFAAFGLGSNATTVGPNSTVATNGFDRPAACSGRTMSIADVAVFEGNVGTTNASIGVNMSSSSSTTLTVNYATGGGTATPSAFANGTQTTIPSSGNASPYPSIVTVPALGGAVTKVTVAINNFSHTFPRDVDMLLVGPTGQTVVLLSDGGSGTDAVNVNLVFDDAGAAVGTSTIPSGTYRPTNIEDSDPVGDIWPGPAPVGPYGTTLAGFNGLNPAGDWRLYVVDDVGGDAGSVASWSLSFETGSPADYNSAAGRLTFGPSVVGRTITVPVLGDATVEPNETVLVTLSNFNGGALADAVGVLTIVDDDAAPVASVMTSPANGSTIAASTTFTWTAGTGVAENYLDVGTSLDAGDIYSASQGYGATSRTVSGIPQTGGTIYVRLWSRHSTGWVSQRYTYVAGSTPATMLTPTPGSTFTATSATFTWTSGTGVSQIWLSVGTSVGGTDIYDATQGTATSRTVTGLPTTGQTVYVRLWSLRAAGWSSIDYTYIALDHRAILTLPAMAPAPGGTLPGAAATFQWTSGGSSVTSRWLSVGSAAGGTNFYNLEQGSATSVTVTGLPTDNSLVHVRLWSRIGATWWYRDYSFRAYDATLANLTSPANGSALTGTSATFNWTAGTGVTEIWLSVGTAVGGNAIYNVSQGTATSRTVSGLPTGGERIYVRLWSLQGGIWKYIDYNFTAIDFKAVLVLPAPGGVLPGATSTFKWTNGTGVTSKWLYVGTTLGGADLYNAEQFALTQRTVSGLPTNASTVYVRLWSQLSGVWLYTDYSFRSYDATMAGMTSPANGATFGGASVTFNWTNSTTAQTWLSVGTTIGGVDFFNASTGTGTAQAVSGLPTNGVAIYVRLWTNQSSVWRFIDYHYTAFAPPSAAVLILPTAGGNAPGSTAVFRWTTGGAVTNKWLWVGTTVGGSDLYNAEQFSATQVQVNGLPTSGVTLYARLWSYIGGAWQYTDATFKAFDTTMANMTSPADNTTLGGSSVTFNWNRPGTTTEVFLDVGTSVGGFSIYRASEGTGTSRMVTGLPTNGSPVYVRLWSLVGGTWKYIDYYYTSAGSFTELSSGNQGM